MVAMGYNPTQTKNASGRELQLTIGQPQYYTGY